MGEISSLILDECRAQGLQQEQMIVAGTPAEGVTKVIDLVQPGDLALLLVLSERNKVFQLLEQATQ